MNGRARSYVTYILIKLTVTLIMHKNAHATMVR